MACGAGLMLWPLVAAADLAVALEFEHTKLLRFEPVIAFVTIENQAATPFVIESAREDPRARVRLRVERRYEPLAPVNARPLVRALEILPGKQQRLMIRLSSQYDVTALGGYNVTAVADWNDRSYASQTVHLEVEDGLPLTSATRSAPGAPGAVRTYALRYLAREGNERLFLCVDEEETGLNYGVFDLGRLVRVVPPKLELDASGNVMVIHQATRGCYLWTLFKATRDGVTFVDQTYHRADGSVLPSKEGAGGAAPRS
jgi:hypothetical protein